MSKFAGQMIQKMSLTVTSLESALGPGTANLTIRIGVSLSCLLENKRYHITDKNYSISNITDEFGTNYGWSFKGD